MDKNFGGQTRDQPFFGMPPMMPIDYGMMIITFLELMIQALIPPKYLVNDEPTKIDMARYYDEIKRFDHHIGEVVATLKNKKFLKIH